MRESSPKCCFVFTCLFAGKGIFRALALLLNDVHAWHYILNIQDLLYASFHRLIIYDLLISKDGGLINHSEYFILFYFQLQLYKP